jgi:hypothetical protein
LAKEPSARFDDAAALVAALDAMSTEPPPAHANAAMAIAPTVIAEPAGWRWIFARRWALTRRWMTTRKGRIVAAASGLLLVVAFVLAIQAGQARTRSTAADSNPSPLSPLELMIQREAEEAVASAQTKMDKGDLGSAIDELTAAERKYPASGAIHGMLEHAYTAAHRPHDALHEAALWLASDRDGAADDRLEEDVRSAALAKDTQDDAFALLESKMGARGVDLLYDLAYGGSGRQSPIASGRAKRSLDAAEVRAHASPSLRIALDLRNSKACEQRRTLLPDARDRGDARTLTLLQSYASTRGCGFLGLADCYPCLHRDSALADAIQAIQDRATR